MVGGFVNNENKRAGANEESSPFNLRLPHATRDALDAVAAQLPILSKHRIAVAALDIGLAALASNPAMVLSVEVAPRGGAIRTARGSSPGGAIRTARGTDSGAPVPAEPPLVVSPSTPPRRATLPPARASVPPPPRIPAELVETEAARVDPRQLPLIAEPPADLDGMTVRVMPLETVAEVRARIAALQATNPKLSNRKIGSLAGLSNAPVDKIMRGGNVRPETLAMIVAALPRE